MFVFFCIGSGNIDNPNYSEALKTIAADGALTNLAVVVELMKSQAKLLKKAVQKNTSIQRICCQWHNASCICDLSFIKNKQSRITEQKL
jgi:transketolase N-terminal domain/subunit